MRMWSFSVMSALLTFIFTITTNTWYFTLPLRKMTYFSTAIARRATMTFAKLDIDQLKTFITAEDQNLLLSFHSLLGFKTVNALPRRTRYITKKNTYWNRTYVHKFEFPRWCHSPYCTIHHIYRNHYWYNLPFYTGKYGHHWSNLSMCSLWHSCCRKLKQSKEMKMLALCQRIVMKLWPYFTHWFRKHTDIL
jgi:hypothetical protein